MATDEVLFSGGLLPEQTPRPYKSIISYMSKGDALSPGEFDKTHLSKSHWLDVSKNKCVGKGKKLDPNCLFNIFGDLLDCDARSVREQAMAEVTNNFNYYTLAATVVLSMRKQSLTDWLTVMRRYDTPGDEIVLYAMSRMARIHSIVYSKTATWCTVAVAQPILPSDLHKTCTVKLMFLGNRGFGELVQKPSYSMPVYYPDIHRESIYSSGYYEEVNTNPEVPPPTQGNVINNVSPNEKTSAVGNIQDVVLGSVTMADQEVMTDKNNEYEVNTNPEVAPPTQGNVTNNVFPNETTSAISNIKDVVLSSVTMADQEVMTDKNNEYEVHQDNSAARLEAEHEFEMTVDIVSNAGDMDEHLLLPILEFPSSTSVCTTSSNSALQNFNPLEESEPNLDLDVMYENNDRQDPIITNDILIDDARTKVWKVPVRNLTPEEVEFLSGPKLLPSLGTNTDMIENNNQTDLDESNDSESTIVMSNTEHDITPEGESNINKLVRPKRKCAVKTDKSLELIDDDEDDMDEDYLPTNSPKRRTKPGPSASRISARNFDKTHKTVKIVITNVTPTAKETNEKNGDHDGLKQKSKGKTAKGTISIKTFGIPKKTKERKMKCPSCPKICGSMKERNDHHKEAHGKLTCAVCSESFDTPSALDKHKYRHVEQRFKCTDCDEVYPFESQLKEHRMKHRTKKSYRCMSSKCGKWFKIESSLKKHVLIHDSVVHNVKLKRDVTTKTLILEMYELMKKLIVTTRRMDVISVVRHSNIGCK